MPQTSAPATLVVDPVCGMKIDPAKAVGSSLFKGQTVHFCSRGCEAKFDSSPAQYAGPAVTEPAACCSTSGSSCC